MLNCIHINPYFLWFQTQNRSMDESKSQQDCDGAQKMLKTLRGIINRLTPEKFDALMKRVDDLKVENEETLNAVVKLIIDKALSDESHCMIYAKMCLHMKEVHFSNTLSSTSVSLPPFETDC